MRNHFLRAASYRGPVPDIVGTSTAFANSNISTMTFNVPAGTKPGDLILIWARTPNVEPQPNPTTGWTSSGVFTYSKLWYRNAPSTVPATYQFIRSSSVGSMSGVMVVVDGSDPLTWLTYANLDSTAAISTVTAGQNSELVLVANQWNFAPNSITSKDSDLEVLDNTNLFASGGTLVLNGSVPSFDTVSFDTFVGFSSSVTSRTYGMISIKKT